MVLNLFLLFFISGLMAGSVLPVLPSVVCQGLIVSISLFFFLLYSFSLRHRLLLQQGWLYAAALCMGLSWALYFGYQILAQRLPDLYAGEDFQVEGVVINLPEQTERGERFDLYVEQVLRASIPLEKHFLLKKLHLNSYRVTAAQEFEFQPGQRWRLWVRLKPPRGLVNPYGFDYEGWLLQEGYSAVGYVRSAPENIQIFDQRVEMDFFETHKLDLKKQFDRWGFASLQWINAHIDSIDQRSLFAAIALGYKEEFTRHHWDMLKNTGTIHLVVVSGLNIVLAASVGYFLLGCLCRLLFFPLFIFPAPVWGATGAIVLAVFYAGMTGLSLPTQRSLVMVLCGLMTILLRQQISLANGFLLALTAVLVIDPLAVFGASLCLSFGAVAVLLYSFSSRIIVNRKKMDFLFFIKQWLATQMFVSLGIFPLLAYWMGSVPLVMPFANLLAVPFATFVLLPLTIISGLCFMLTPAIGHFVLEITGWGMDLFWWFLQFMQQFNINWYMTMANVERGDVPSSLALLLSIMAIFILLSPRGMVPRYAGIFLFLPLLCPLHHKLPRNEFALSVVDVGQGLSVLIETADTVTVYDVGDRYSDQFDMGRDVVAQLIRRKGYDHVDSLIISHSDSDHAGGLKGLLGELKATQILSGNADILQQRLDSDANIRDNKVRIEPCVKGQSWLYDEVRFDVISPSSANAMTGILKKRNNNSCVVKISNAHFSVLLTGDIESNLETSLLKEGGLIKADVLIVPHHGSKTSSGLAFLKAVAPQLSIVSVGYKSQYGHPHAEVIERYRELGIPFWRTDQAGAIALSSPSDQQQPIASRLNSVGYWRRW